MGTEVENAAGDTQSTLTTPPSTASITCPKTSMFAKKSGFVIPKNKLSGSLVPVFRATKKGDGDSVKEEAPIQIQRKTKWGPDLSQDTSVRKGRILAYQTRINQISQQLTLGSLEIKDNQDPLSTSEFHDENSSDHQLNAEKSELLELERREIIGELLKLNPSYKAPANYKPIMKEAKVPIPIREYPGYNFIGLVFGPANDTQKRLEKETGAKVRVFGSKAETGGKVEVTATDGKDAANTYKDLYVHVSADTFEKVDAAVALIELLVTPVSVNPVSALSTSTAAPDENVNSQPSQHAPSSIIAPPLTNQGTAQPYSGFLPPPRGQFPQYPQPWFPAGPPQTTISSSPFSPSNMPSLYGLRPVMTTSFSPVSQNPSNVPSSPQLPNDLLPYGPRNTPPISLTGPPNRPFISVSPIGTSPIQPLSMRPVQPPMPFQVTSSALPAPKPVYPNSLSMAIPRPQQPSSGDFTFQPHRPPFTVPNHNVTPPIQTVHSPSAPQSPFLRPMIHNHQMNQPRPQMSNFAVSPPVPQFPPRHPTLMNPNAAPFPPLPHMQPRNFIPPHSINNSAGPFPPRPENLMHIQQNHHFGPTRPQMFPTSNQPFGNQPRRPFGSYSGVQQKYDPFSPTSTPFNNPPMRGNPAKAQDGSDPEYEDLMASVGVK